MRENKTPTNLELLNLAKELAYADYNNCRANIHNQWLADNETMKRLRGIGVPYPPIPAYPSEEEIIYRAKKLIEFLDHPRPDEEKQVPQENINQSIADIEDHVTDNFTANEITINNQENVESVILKEAIEKSANDIEKESVFEKLKNAWR